MVDMVDGNGTVPGSMDAAVKFVHAVVASVSQVSDRAVSLESRRREMVEDFVQRLNSDSKALEDPGVVRNVISNHLGKALTAEQLKQLGGHEEFLSKVMIDLWEKLGRTPLVFTKLSAGTFQRKETISHDKGEPVVDRTEQERLSHSSTLFGARTDSPVPLVPNSSREPLFSSSEREGWNLGARATAAWDFLAARSARFWFLGLLSLLVVMFLLSVTSVLPVTTSTALVVLWFLVIMLTLVSLTLLLSHGLGFAALLGAGVAFSLLALAASIAVGVPTYPSNLRIAWLDGWFERDATYSELRAVEAKTDANTAAITRNDARDASQDRAIQEQGAQVKTLTSGLSAEVEARGRLENRFNAHVRPPARRTPPRPLSPCTAEQRSKGYTPVNDHTTKRSKCRPPIVPKA
jgi:hypothetical protein